MPQSAGDYELVVQHIVPSPPEWEAMVDEYRCGDQVRLLGHLTFFKFSPSVFKSFMRAWSVFRTVLTAPVLVYGKTDDEKFARFVQHLGFVPFTTLNCQDGLTRRMFIQTIQDRDVVQQPRTNHQVYKHQLDQPVGTTGR